VNLTLALRYTDPVILDLVTYVGPITCAHVLFRGSLLYKECTVFCRSIVGPEYRCICALYLCSFYAVGLSPVQGAYEVYRKSSKTRL
jgi:hypothetical protein